MLGEMLAAFLYKIYETLLNGGGASIASLQLPANLIDFAETLWTFLSSIGLGLTLVYFLYDINMRVGFEGRDVTVKTLIAPMLKLVLAFAILSHGANIVNGLLQFYNTSLGTVNAWQVTTEGSVSTVEADTEETELEKWEKHKAEREEITAAIGGLGLIEMVGMLPVVLILWVIQAVLSFIWIYKAIVFKLEFLWKLGVTPLALSDCYNGLSSNAVRWIKGLLATAIYGLAFILVIKMGASLMQGDLTGTLLAWVKGESAIAGYDGGFLANFVHGFGTIAQFFIIPFAELGVLGAVKQATKEALA